MEHVHHRPTWYMADLASPFSSGVLVCLAAIVCYLADRLVYVLGIPPDHIAAFWPSTAFLVALLLLVPRRIWPLMIIAGLGAMALADLENGVPMGFEVWITLGNFAEVLVATMGIRFLFKGVPQLNNLKAWAKYVAFAVILVPFGSALVGANGSGPGGYLLQWRLWFFADALAFLTVAPALLCWADDRRASPRKSHNYLEFAALMTFLVLFGYLTFMGIGRGPRPVLLYSLVPILLWAALRLGLKGVSTSMLVVALLSIWGAADGRGPFAEQGPLNNALSLQLFLFFAAIPFTILAALVEEQKRAQLALIDKEAQLSEAQHLAQMGSWQWDPKTDGVTWSDEIYRISGYNPKHSPPTFKDHKQFFTPESWDRLYRSAELTMQTGEPYALDLEGFRLDGTRLWITSRGEAIRDASGRPIQLRGTFENITERKRAENALRAGEERFRLAAQAGKMFAYEWDAATDVIVRSGESAPILGIDEATCFTGQQALTKVHPDDRAGLLAALAEISPEKPSLQVSYRMVRPDGNVIWVERNSRAQFDKQNRILRIVGMVADVTERKRTEEALHQKERELSEAQRVAGVGSWHWYEENDVVIWSEELYRIAGRDPTRPAPNYKEHSSLFTPESWVRLSRSVDEALRDGTSYKLELEMVRPDGTTRWIRTRGEAMRNSTGRIVGLRGTSQDITERKLSERELILANDRLRLAMESGGSVGWEGDIRSGRTTWFGDQKTIFGMSSETYDEGNEDFYRSVHPEDQARVQEVMKDAMQSRTPYAIEFRTLRPDGTVRWVSAKGKVYYSPDGEPERNLGIMLDITERKLAEEALSKVGGRLIEAHEEERAWIARELHDDINQRVALLANGLELMQQDLPDSAVEIHNRVCDQLKRANEISADVQAISHRLHSSKLRYLGIVGAAKSFCQELSELHKVEIDFTHADIPPDMPEDISLCLFRIMQESLQNAVKHSGVRQFEVGLRGAPGGIHLTVHDAGHGFDPEAAMSNRGLGLVSMQERTNLVKGTLLIDSRPERGTTIHACLPLSLRSESARAAGN